MTITLRPHQEEIMTYASGKMGISAVPGSGKTWTLSLLAAELISSGILADEQEILIVTLVNSAVDNFYQRISSFIEKRGLIPNIGYRVRTLHGLAHDIVRERPDLLGLDSKFLIIDERETDGIRDDIAKAWLQTHSAALDHYLNLDLEESQIDWIRREQLPELVKDIASSFIRYAKDSLLTPEKLQQHLEQLPLPLPLAELGYQIYVDYQRALAYRGGVDFDDLIRLALQALEWDATLLEKLRYQWPYILEDEAQDSSFLQEQILRKLVGAQGNWVRVGDPNQAIYETFTTANPKYLRDFTREPGVIRRELPISGRSTPTIINLANHLVKWTMTAHPLPEVRDALSTPPDIQPAPSGDPQPSPPDEDTYLRLVNRKFSPTDEIRLVVDSIERWMPEHEHETLAVLAPRNQRAFELVDELARRQIRYHDGLLRSSSSTRSSASALEAILRYLSDPKSASKLATAYKSWRRDDETEEDTQQTKRLAERLRKISHVEDFIWPRPGVDWLETSGLYQDEHDYAQLAQFRLLLRRWQDATLLPVDQIILTLSQDLLTEVAELAVAHKLAVLLRQANHMHPDWRLPELAGELSVIASNERRFIGFSDSDVGFDPDQYKGTVVVSTIHKAKGLEWDRVYIMSANNYDFPSAMSYDRFISEKWFLRDSLNLEAEALAQLKTILSNDPYAWYEEGKSTQEARLDYARERLRLLYVGITRARKELIITWNSGRKGDLQPALPLVELQTYLETPGIEST